MRAPEPPARSATRLATIASSLPYSNSAPSDEAATIAPAAVRVRTSSSSGAVAFQS